ncbi:2OG-Fe(II) oxygenase [Ammoniphilus sp. YIM 78166]|uniref:2OG-Fe(II) oxygenase n=1 Tax=Ammoniphilus sp. YIM 78166 TaxID=1644106 RepID=UPI00106F3687|nr:2OG-Fe(II) oxygenase [Ammoniphilus sp. YIM 78166]
MSLNESTINELTIHDLTSNNITTREPTIFNHSGNKIQTEDRQINIIAKLEEPLIVILGNVLSEEECDALIELSRHKMERSRIGAVREVNDLRTSSGLFLEGDENELVARVERRMSQIMNIPIEHGEGLHILNYKIGQEYKAHFDFFSNKSVSNPRISTLVMYLNDPLDGGETFFPKLNFSVYPQKGMAVYFEYFYHDPTLNERTLHGSAPVITGEKWAASQWMRRQRLK